jgi:hypothetical protein
MIGEGIFPSSERAPPVLLLLLFFHQINSGGRPRCRRKPRLARAAAAEKQRTGPLFFPFSAADTDHGTNKTSGCAHNPALQSDF